MGKRYWYITPEDYKIAEENGIKKGTLNHRVKCYGWDIDKAITKKPKKRIIPKDLLIQAKSIGLDSKIISDRLRIGWTIERACSEPFKKRKT